MKITSKPKRMVRRVIGFFLIFILLFTVTSMIFSAVTFRALFRRTDALTDYVEITYNQIASDGYIRKAVSFPSGGNRLSGYLYGDSGARALIIIAPGMNSNSDSHLAEIMCFVDNGYRVLAYDATGVCQSEGSSTVGLQQARLDLLAAISYAESTPGLAALPIILYGHSLGGYAAAAVLDEGDVAAVISLSGFNSPVETMHDKAKEYVGIFADIQYPFLFLQNVFTFGGNANPTAVDAINSGDTPVLICYGENDSTIPYELSLYSHSGEITNPNTDCVCVDAPYRSGHTGMWLSSESAKYVSELQNQLDDLNTIYDGEIPDEVLQGFYSGIDTEKATGLDEDFMAMLLDFCSQSLA